MTDHRKPHTTPVKSWTFDDHTNSYIRRAAATGIYDIRGGGAKPWKQKGTGRARIGSIRNPSRVHGGSAFGPKPHLYNLKVNKKVKLLAKKSALSIKISSNTTDT